MLTIGQLASRTGVNIQTVRYYERRGLLAPPARTGSGYRQFSPETVARLRAIRRAQNLGFSLEEIRALLELGIERPSNSARVRVRVAAEAKVRLVEQKIHELQRIKRNLARLLVSCRARTPSGECPILGAIEFRGGKGEEVGG